DISHYKRIKTEELQEIELLANKLVMDNIGINTFWMDRTTAEKKYGFILYQGGVVPGMSIRTVEIEGTDVQACAGTHCNKTGDVGLIKIIKTERIQDGVERIEFSAGEAAIEAIQASDDLLKGSAAVFKVEPGQLPKTCDRFFSEWKSFKNEIKRLKEGMATLKMQNLMGKALKIGDLKVLEDIIDADMGEMQKMSLDLTDEDGEFDIVLLGNLEGKLVGTASKRAIKFDIKINEIIKEAAGILGGGGGGRHNLAQGAGPNVDKMREALDFALTKLKEEF
ncbi:MAG: DHHA1 domain-containing protein, partial [Methanobacterium sp.]